MLNNMSLASLFYIQQTIRLYTVIIYVDRFVHTFMTVRRK